MKICLTTNSVCRTGVKASPRQPLHAKKEGGIFEVRTAWPASFLDFDPFKDELRARVDQEVVNFAG